MKKIHRPFTLFLLLCIPLTSFSNKPVKVIFDTDMGPDFDDVGAIAVLHALAVKGECEIIACGASDGYPTTAPTIEVFNHYFGHPDIPIGVPGEDAPSFSCPNHWNDSIVMKFLTEQKTNDDYPSVVDVYRKALSQAPDKSVAIITIGFTSNLYNLLKSKADAYSKLNGEELVKKKVKKWVAMAGGFPQGNEFNVNQHPEASFYVFNRWPTPILFSGFEIGSKIFTGNDVSKNDPILNPVAWAYKYNLATYGNEKLANRESWDQTAVLCAIRNPDDYFYINGPGKFIIYRDGSNAWNPETDAQHFFLSHKYPYEIIAKQLEQLMLYKPEN